MELLSCTVAQNSTGGGGPGGSNASRHPPSVGAAGGDGGSGGGLFSGGTNSLCLFRNSLIALNNLGIAGAAGLPAGVVGADGDGPDVVGEFTSGGYNLVGQAQGSIGITNDVNRDLVGNNGNPIDPLLGHLQDNGGPTLTHALLTGSPAVDAGRSFGIRRDQRGEHRPFNYPLIPRMPGGDSSDIGAYELHAR
jgi:hypothetical protein